MKIIFNKTFRKKYKKLPKNIRSAFEERLEIFKEDSKNPILKDHGLKGTLLGLRAFSVTGDYRAIYQKINQDIIYFGDIGPHSQIYD